MTSKPDDFGRDIGGSRWFNQVPTLGERVDKQNRLLITWLCPMDGCNGEMKSTGKRWLSSPPGFHHACTKCGFQAALEGVEYPARTPSARTIRKLVKKAIDSK